MALKVMADNNQSITAAQDGAMYNVFANNSDFVIKGIGGELAITRSTTSLSISMATGECVLCGRHVTNTASLGLTLSPNTSGYIVIRYDSTNTSYVSLTYTSSISNDNINGSGQLHDIVLGQFTTNANGVSTYKDMRTIKSSANPTIYYGTSEPSASLGNDGDIYIKYED